jgi:hypothetical protein
MRLTIKLIFILFLLLLASSLLLMMPGCGKALTGSGSGGCPDSTAPDGSTITGPTALGTPLPGGTCYPTLTFNVKDPDGLPMNNICVEVYTNASVALHSGLPNCSNVTANPQSAIVTRTDHSGNVVIELATPVAATGDTFFVHVSSGAADFEAVTPAAP